MQRYAFSLVELSIVLVILGLLTGGILAGQSLIRAAELRGVTAQTMQYRSAVYSFRDKYFALPGDMANATSFWTSAGGDGSNNACITAQTTTAATCNGTGDGTIQGTSTWANSERFTAWKHLANAGLVEGSYTGKTTGAVGSYEVSVGSNVPAAKSGNGFIDLGYLYPQPTIWFSGSKTSVNSISLYGIGTSAANPGTLKPEEAWNIDTKQDDGSPVTGAVITSIRSSPYGGNCASSDANTATYDFAITGKNCILVWTLQ